MSSDQIDLEYIENSTTFSCPICLSETIPGNGIVLKNCSHTFCKSCVTKVIQHASGPEVECPYVTADNQKCLKFIQDRELRCFITNEDYIRLLGKSLELAEISSKQSFHCQRPNCIGWVEIVGNNLRSFRCPICMALNCVTCKALHEGMACVVYRRSNMTNSQKTNLQIQKLLREKKVMRCPKCGILVEKTKGCNHLKCTKCKHDFQWIGSSGFEWVR